MATATHKPGNAPAQPTSNVIQLDIPDDLIPTRTAIPLLDPEPDVAARRLRRLPWEDRVSFFNSISYESFNMFMFFSEGIAEERDRERFQDWFL